MAFGPMPCSAMTSASVNRDSFERLVTPAAANARCAGAASFGRSEEVGGFFAANVRLAFRRRTVCGLRADIGRSRLATP